MNLWAVGFGGIGREIIQKLLLCLWLKEARAKRIAAKLNQFVPSEAKCPLHGDEVVVHIPAEISGIIGIYRDAKAEVKQGLKVMDRKVVEHLKLYIGRGQTVSGT